MGRAETRSVRHKYGYEPEPGDGARPAARRPGRARVNGSRGLERVRLARPAEARWPDAGDGGPASGQPPVGVAEQVHRARNEHGTQDERVQLDRRRQPDAELGDVPRAHESGGGPDRSRPGQSARNPTNPAKSSLLEQHADRVFRVTGVRGQVMPPDALITSPVTQRESSEARNTAALARSSGLPSRPSGVWATN